MQKFEQGFSQKYMLAGCCLQNNGLVFLYIFNGESGRVCHRTRVSKNWVEAANIQALFFFLYDYTAIFSTLHLTGIIERCAFLERILSTCLRLTVFILSKKSMSIITRFATG